MEELKELLDTSIDITPIAHKIIQMNWEEGLNYITQHPKFTYTVDMACGFIMNNSSSHLMKCGVSADEELIYIAACMGSIECLLYLFTLFPKNHKFQDGILEIACIMGDIEVIYILLDHGIEPTECAIVEAEAREYKSIVNLLRKII